MGGGLKNIKTLDIFDNSLGNSPDTSPNFNGMTFKFGTVMKLCIPYRTKFRRTKFSPDKIFRWTKISPPSQNFATFVRRICINLLFERLSPDKIFARQNISPDKNFATKPNFRHFCPAKFCPIRYVDRKLCRKKTELNAF